MKNEPYAFENSDFINSIFRVLTQMDGIEFIETRELIN